MRGLRAPELDRCLRRLARHEARCRLVLGRLAGRFLRRRAHHRLGFARLGDYSRERLGLSAREMQSMAHVVEAAQRLPGILAAFSCGEISWTQLRMLAAAATVDTEQQWLALARGSTVRTLEEQIREAANACAPRADTNAIRNTPAVQAPPVQAPAVQAEAMRAEMDACEEDGRLVDGEAEARFRLRCSRRVRALWREVVDLARRVAGEALPVWQAAEAIAAEGLSGPARGPDDAGTAQPPRRAVAPARDRAGMASPDGAHALLVSIDRAAVAGAIPEDIEHLGRDCEDLDGFALDASLRAVVRALQQIDWQTGRLLRIFFAARLHVPLGFSSASHYIRERLGMCPRKARMLVALDRRCNEAPVLAEAYRRGDVSWLQALTLLPVVCGRAAAPEGATAAVIEARTAWVTRLREVTLRRLVDEVAWALDVRDTGAPEGPMVPPPLGATLVRPVRQMRAHDGCETLDVAVTFNGPASVVALLQSAIAAFEGPLDPLWVGFEKLLEHARAEWEHLPRHRDPIFGRDGWRCAVPACSSRRNLQDHHIRFRSRGGDNARTNRVTVCAGHHLHGIHVGRVRAWGKAPDGIHWALGVRPGHPPLLELVGDRYANPSDGRAQRVDRGDAA